MNLELLECLADSLMTFIKLTINLFLKLLVSSSGWIFMNCIIILIIGKLV